jgi:non-ribosomal peptide synthetase component F
VAVSQAALLNLVEAGRAFADLDQRPVVSHVANPAFDVSMFEIWCPLLTGGTVAIVENPNPIMWGPWLLRIADGRPTVMTLTTSIFHQIARTTPKALHGITTILFGGEMAAADIIRSLVESGFAGTLKNMYGPTEATTATAWEVTDEWLRSRVDTVPVGPPVHGAVVGLRDENGSAVGGDGVGELVIGGAGLADGYVGDDALTAQRFTDDPAGLVGGTVYWTGDLARWCENGTSVMIVGRADRQLKVRGFRIEPGEVEAALRAYSSVLEAAVVAVGEGANRFLAALVVLRGDHDETTADGLASALRRRLPSYMVPKQIKPVTELPRTNSRKIDLAEVRRILEPRDHIDARVSN